MRAKERCDVVPELVDVGAGVPIRAEALVSKGSILRGVVTHAIPLIGRAILSKEVENGPWELRAVLGWVEGLMHDFILLHEALDGLNSLGWA